MYKMIKTVCFSITMILSVSAAFAGPDMNPGRWRITTETEMAGMPVKMPPMVTTQCLTHDDLVPQDPKAGQECRITDVKVTGNKVSWAIFCKGQGGTMEGKGSVTYQGDEMNGSSMLEMKEVGMKMSIKMKGKRIGDCD